MKSINTYTCVNKHNTVTIDTPDHAVTPMFITCPVCREQATSHGYLCPQNIKPNYEWFFPENIDEFKDACIPIYGDVFSDADYMDMMREMIDRKGPPMYRKIERNEQYI